MKQPITMPALSDTMETGHLHQWLKQPGDAIKKGQAIAEVESDKAVMEIEAFADGYLQGPLAATDADYKIGETIAWLSDTATDTENNEAIPPASEPQTARPQTAPSTETKTAEAAPLLPTVNAAAASQHKSSPYARGLARDLGISLEHIAPSADGIIHGKQVLAAALAPPQPDLKAGPPYRYKLLTPMHRAVADNMSATLQTPTFRVSSLLDLQPLQEYAKANGFSLSLLLARACALAIKKHPLFNAAYTDAGLALRDRVDVGIAVDVPGGLLTPVLRDMAQKSLADLSADWQKLKQKIARRRLQPEDYQGATFYLSNLGTFPAVSRFDAIVPLGACAILALGAAQKNQAEATLSCDHRVVYGAEAGRFFSTLQNIIKQPEGLTDV